ncbi:polysaccharide pyruvyl transferase family protein [Prosthecobacter fluviatilis]|uniref:Polysaccharide pyruvyl transferase family protein n=1 Tax=Prosthecobacter fluviatilis TaxID=445931 RepID=A0ABW0KJI0_9BACT
MKLLSHIRLLADHCAFLCMSVAHKWSRSARKTRREEACLIVHIGHHFWGAGNVGDDLMLAGFLSELRKAEVPVRLTCCVPAHHEHLRILHPEVEWKPYAMAGRWRAISEADCWLGLGGTPFQVDSGDWLERHLDVEREICECLNKPMYFLGVGVGNAEALQRPKYKRLINVAKHFWGRDEMSTALLAEASGGKASLAADMANLFFSQHRPLHMERSIGCLLHFEDRSHFSLEAFCDLFERHSDQSRLWLIQESRHLRWSEKALWQELPAAVQAEMRLSQPEWAAQNMNELLNCWGMPEVLISSRYHGALMAAWSGSRVVIIARNGKLAGLARQLGLLSVAKLSDPSALSEAISRSKAVSTESLMKLARMASNSVKEWLQQMFSQIAHPAYDRHI